MKKHYFFIFFLVSLFSLSGTAQPCYELELQLTTLQTGQIEAILPVRGDLFFDSREAGFRISTEPGQPKTTTVFAAGLWLGGIDDGGAFKVAAQTYGASNGRYDFYPGPLDDQGLTDSATCQQFNRAWLVQRHEVEAHIEDHAQDGVIDRPITAVYAWPGLGNPFFEAYNGFELPGYAGELAPFQDVNGDGMYNPAGGDYPRLEDVPYIPEFIHWTIFNDNGDIHRQTTAPEPIQAEIQLTTFALSCTELPLLDRTIFTQYKVFNRAVEPIDSFYHGFWSDTDLGRPEDDYIGSYPNGHAVFTYNADSIDGFGDQCFFGQYPDFFCNRIPVQSHIFLDRDLSKFTYYQNSAFGNPPPAVTDPKNFIEYYLYLSGAWRDGSPLAFGGSGYVPGGDPTDFAFPDDPRDPDGWSMRTSFDAAFVRYIASSYIGRIPPSGAYTLTMAHSFHFAPGNDGWLDNLGVMYAEVDALQAWYDGDRSCRQPEICRGDDCVWAGDADANGIVNQYDLLPIAAAIGQNGPRREGPYTWRPATGDDWGAILPISNRDAKHADCIGDGIVELSDLQKVDEHFGLRRPGFSPINQTYPQGPDLQIEATGLNLEQVTPGSNRALFTVQFSPPPEPLRALAFTLEYDTAFWDPGIRNVESTAFQDVAIIQTEPGKIHFGFMQPDTGAIPARSLLQFEMGPKEAYPIALPANQTRIRFSTPRAVDLTGQFVPLRGTDKVATFSDIVVSTEEPRLNALAFHLAPNPSPGRLALTFGEAVERQVRVLDLLGREVVPPQEIRGRRESLKLNHLPAGLYVVEVRAGKRFGVKRWLKR